MTILTAASVFVIGLAAAAIALSLAHVLARRNPGPDAPETLFGDTGAGIVFLFDGELLLDATPDARGFLTTLRQGDDAWQRLLFWALPRFADLGAQIDRLAETGRFTVRSRSGDGMMLIAEWLGGIRRITLLDAEPHAFRRPGIPLWQTAQAGELALLRQVTDALPIPVWQAGDGGVLWANPAAMDLIERKGIGQGGGWPGFAPFEVTAPGRHRLDLPDSAAPLWFDCHVSDLTSPRTVYAIPANPAVQAERALSSFVSTLTKVYSALPVGLAIFGKDRRLHLFNPAFTDLTRLPITFLSAQPTLFAVLDQLREAGSIPEPRDYKAWRDGIAPSKAPDHDTTFEETWTLPAGQTYRVNVRAHTEGTLALLVEDITDAMAWSRRLRADLETGLAVIDAMDEGIAVFCTAGQLVMSNAAYARLWDHDPMSTVADMPVAQVVARWQARCAPGAFFGLVEAQIAAAQPRQPAEGMVRLLDGRALRCRMLPLAGGATLVGFSPSPPAADTGTSAWPHGIDAVAQVRPGIR